MLPTEDGSDGDLEKGRGAGVGGRMESLQFQEKNNTQAPNCITACSSKLVKSDEKLNSCVVQLLIPHVMSSTQCEATKKKGFSALSSQGHPTG